MKKLSFIALLIFTALQITATKAFDGGKDKEVIIRTVIYCDHCAGCGDCEPKIKTAAKSVDGVRSATLDVEAQTIKVIYNPEITNEKAIRTAISNAGYTADNVQANPDAYAKLDECCKKKS
jgi:mercuric ion binding protein